MSNPLNNEFALDLQDLLRKLPTQASAARQPLIAADNPSPVPAPAAPASAPEMSREAQDATGAGITGAAGAFKGILEALARSQAIKSQVENDESDRSSMRRVVEGKIQTSGRDFDSKQRTNGLQSLIEMMRQAQDQRAAGTALQQQATSGMTDAMLRRGK